MILLTGSAGDGGILGVFIVRPGTSGQPGWVSSSDTALDNLTPPCAWSLPPPSSKWMKMDDGYYGPSFMEFEPGFIQDSEDSMRAKPCIHSTISGTLMDVGKGSEDAIYFTQLDDFRTTYWYCGNGIEPYLPEEKLYCLRGRPCKRLVDMSVYDRDGSIVTLPLELKNNLGDYWLNSLTTIGNLSGDFWKDSLGSEGYVPYSYGDWYARKNGSTAKPTNLADNVFIFKTEWDIRNRLTWVRTLTMEYHTPASYTPDDSLGYSNVGNTVEATLLVTTLKLKRIRSTMPGHFQISYDLKHEWLSHGWVPWAPYSSHGSEEHKSQTSAILLLEPGMKKRNVVSAALKRPQQLCQEMPTRIHETSSFAEEFSKSRLAALNDIQALKSNWIENLSGLSGSADIVTPLLDGSAAVSNGDLRMARNALAAAYLAYSYAVAPTLSDSEDIGTNGSQILRLIEKQSTLLQRRRGRFQFELPLQGQVAQAYTADCYYLQLKNNPFAKLWAALQKIGLEPSAGKLWATVPFSFVLDWFVKVGPILKDISSYNDAVVNYNVAYRVESLAVKMPIPNDQIDFLFESDRFRPVGRPLLYKWYDRKVLDGIGDVNPFVLSTSSSLSKSQMTQGAALLTTIFL